MKSLDTYHFSGTAKRVGSGQEISCPSCGNTFAGFKFEIRESNPRNQSIFVCESCIENHVAIDIDSVNNPKDAIDYSKGLLVIRTLLFHLQKEIPDFKEESFLIQYKRNRTLSVKQYNLLVRYNRMYRISEDYFVYHAPIDTGKNRVLVCSGKNVPIMI